MKYATIKVQRLLLYCINCTKIIADIYGILEFFNLHDFSSIGMLTCVPDNQSKGKSGVDRTDESLSNFDNFDRVSLFHCFTFRNTS